MVILALVRHGQSQGNAEQWFVGQVDCPLTPKGEDEARSAGILLKDYRFDIAYSSTLQRAWRTAELIGASPTRTYALDEKHFGDLQGHPYTVMERYQGQPWVGDWDAAPPGGESYSDIEARVLPFYHSEVVPLLREGRNVLIVAHHHTLLAIVREVERMREHVHMRNAVPRVYDLDDQLQVKSVRDLQ
jgi:2,3-bisphosphoglycerate-dependent phosphoglycerate mutase